MPALGAAIDKGRTDEPYWAPCFAELEPARSWIAEVDPDVCVVVYNEYANGFSLEVIRTFALGLADEVPPTASFPIPRRSPTFRTSSTRARPDPRGSSP